MAQCTFFGRAWITRGFDNSKTYLRSKNKRKEINNDKKNTRLFHKSRVPERLIGLSVDFEYTYSFSKHFNHIKLVHFVDKKSNR